MTTKRVPFPQFEVFANPKITGFGKLMRICPICSKKYLLMNNHLRDTENDEDHAILRVLES